MTAFACLLGLALPSAADGVTYSRAPDQAEVRLSESLLVRFVVEGPMPLRVELPGDLLDTASVRSWRLRPAGPAKLDALPDGRQRWSQQFHADPYVPGEHVPLGFTPASAFAGVNPQAQPVEWPPIAVRVQTEVTGDLSELRPATGIEELPGPSRRRMLPWKWVVGSIALAVVAFALAILVRQTIRRAAAPLAPREWAARELARLAADAPDGPDFAERLSGIVRRFIEMRSAIPATKLTTAELLALLATQTAWPPERSTEFSDLLDQCDVVKFSPPPTSADWEALLAAARRLVSASESEASATAPQTPR